MAAAAIPEGAAAVTMEQDLHRRTVLYMVIPAEEGETVMGFDGNGLEGDASDDVCHTKQVVCNGFILGTDHWIISCWPPFFGGMKRNMVCVIRTGEDQCGKDQ